VELEMKIFTILAITCQILVVSSSFGQKVSYDFDKNTNFEQFKTYKWVYIKGAEQLEAELDRQITLAVDAQLGKKRFEQGRWGQGRPLRGVSNGGL
jgi:hypothetical protein